MTEPHFIARETFGGLDLDLRCGDKSLSIVKIPDEDLADVLLRGLERLSGQGKVPERLRSACYCVGGLNVKG